MSTETRRSRGQQRKLYRTPISYFMEHGLDLGLAADQYGATMAYAWWKHGLHNRQSVFNWFFRENPFGGGYTTFLGLAAIQEFLERVRFTDESLDYLAMLNGRDGKPLFPDDGFFDFLSKSKVEITIDAFAEGSVCFPRQPVVRFRGPVWQIQFWEGFFLNQLNFWTLIGTKTARMVDQANGKPISESGFRRAQGLDGHLTAALASYCAGAAGTSNLLAGMLFGLPTYGTHAHSWVLFHGSNRPAFQSYAEALPNNAVFLVDTFDTLEGVLVAIEVAKLMRSMGHELFGIRLDSGDLSWLSKEARKLLNEAGFKDVKILASDRLNEFKIAQHEREGSMIDIYAPGTELATGGKDSALGGVLKLVAVENEQGVLQDRIKLSSDPAKITIPGLLNTRRFVGPDGKYIGDAIFDERHGMHKGGGFIVDPANFAASKKIPADATFVDKLQRSFENGRACNMASIEQVRSVVPSQVRCLDETIRRMQDPHIYPAGVSQQVDENVRRLILAARGA